MAAREMQILSRGKFGNFDSNEGSAIIFSGNEGICSKIY
jgi:hypothetical protein